MKPNMTEAGADLTAGEDGLNGNFTAIPKDMESAGEASADADLVATPMDFGDMNEADARESGYTDAEGRAVDMAKSDTEGSPTGALTDVGHGRSSVVKKH